MLFLLLELEREFFERLAFSKFADLPHAEYFPFFAGHAVWFDAMWSLPPHLGQLRLSKTLLTKCPNYYDFLFSEQFAWSSETSIVLAMFSKLPKSSQTPVKYITVYEKKCNLRQYGH